MMRGYQDLEVWRKSMELAAECYRVTQRWPRAEVFGLTLQLRRAVVSVPANIAEGRGRRSTKDFLRFLSIAYGSLTEVETYFQLAERLGYLAPPETERLMASAGEIGRMLNGLRASLRSRLKPEDR